MSNQDKVKLFLIITQAIFVSVLSAAVGFEYGAPYGFMTLSIIPILIMFIREIKA